MADNHIHNKLNPYMLAHCITRTRRFGRWRAHNIYVPMYVLVLIFILHLLFYGMRKDDIAIHKLSFGQKWIEVENLLC